MGDSTRDPGVTPRTFRSESAEGELADRAHAVAVEEAAEAGRRKDRSGFATAMDKAHAIFKRAEASGRYDKGR